MPLLATDPHSPEGAQAREDAAADPGGVFAFRGRVDLDAHVFDGHGFDFVEEAVAEALGEGGAAGEDDVGEEVLAQIHVGAVDAVEHEGGDARVFETEEARVEEDFRGAETRGADLGTVNT